MRLTRTRRKLADCMLSRIDQLAPAGFGIREDCRRAALRLATLCRRPPAAPSRLPCGSVDSTSCETRAKRRSNDELVPLPLEPTKPSHHLTTTFGVAEMSSLDLSSLTRRGLLASMMLIASICVSSCGRGGNVRSACNSEIEKLCVGEARAGQCLRRHMDELSAACKDALMNAPNRGGDQ